jgi:hypothetical protein
MSVLYTRTTTLNDSRASPTPRPSAYQRLTPRRRNAERRRRVLQVWRVQSGEDDDDDDDRIHILFFVFYIPSLELSVHLFERFLMWTAFSPPMNRTTARVNPYKGTTRVRACDSRTTWKIFIGMCCHRNSHQLPVGMSIHPRTLLEAALRCEERAVENRSHGEHAAYDGTCSVGGVSGDKKSNQIYVR